MSHFAASSSGLRRAQLLIGAQIAVSVPLQIAFVRIVSDAGAFALPADTLADRLAFALRWQLPPAAMLLTMIGFIAGARPLWSETVGGSPDAARLERHVRVLRNTVEQLFLMVLAHLSLATLLPARELGLVPALALLFVLARLAFWIGYVRNELYRTVGFVATFYPNIYALGLALWLWSR